MIQKMKDKTSFVQMPLMTRNILKTEASYLKVPRLGITFDDRKYDDRDLGRLQEENQEEVRKVMSTFRGEKGK